MSTDQEAQAPKKLRTWSAFGTIRRRPSEYEITTQSTNYTMRAGRFAPLEQNTSSPGNLWLTTYRDGSPFQAEDWEAFRDPDELTYRAYVAMQHDQETEVNGLLEAYAEADHDRGLAAEWVEVLRQAFTPTRYLAHGIQMVQSYLASMAPSAYIGNVAAFAAADQLRRNTLVSYRTRELQLAHPDAGFATGERALWQDHDAWQSTREAIERALTAYDWGEAFTAVNLVIAPTLDDVLIRQLGAAARTSGDELTWLLGRSLLRDTERRARWSTALAAMALQSQPGTRPALDKWIDKWAPRADAAAEALAALLPEPGEVAAQARQTRQDLLAEAGLDAPSEVDLTV